MYTLRTGKFGYFGKSELYIHCICTAFCLVLFHRENNFLIIGIYKKKLEKKLGKGDEPSLLLC